MQKRHRDNLLMAAIPIVGFGIFYAVVANDDKRVVTHERPLSEYRCTDDCTHDGGYSWAESEGVRNSDDCPDIPKEFRQGCVRRAWAAGTK